MKRTTKRLLSNQVKQRVNVTPNKRQEYDGDSEIMISTGSTLLDLSISGGRVKGGGIPAGILVEIFGPSGSGKTVMLCEIAGDVQRKGGAVMFNDPESRLNKSFARIFNLNTDKMQYSTPNTVPEVFAAVRKWEPEEEGINGIFADSLAALSTDLEMDKDEGDKMGMRRAKEFSEELRKTCRILAQRRFLMVCSNQVRQNQDAGPYGPKYRAPGGEAIGFYSSLRLRAGNPTKIKEKKTISGKEVIRVIGVRTEVEVFKSSIWKPFRTAPVTILFDYGIDDIRENLQFLKDHSNSTIYVIGNRKLSKSRSESISIVEEEGLEEKLREEVIKLWEVIDKKFESNRKKKQR